MDVGIQRYLTHPPYYFIMIHYLDESLKRWNIVPIIIKTPFSPSYGSQGKTVRPNIPIDDYSIYIGLYHMYRSLL